MESRKSNTPLTEEQPAHLSPEESRNHHLPASNTSTSSKSENAAGAPSPTILNIWMRTRDKTQKEWCDFIAGKENIDTSIVPPDVLADWKRCRQKNIDPLGIPRNIVLSEDDLQKRLNDNQTMIQISRPLLRKLFDFTRAFSSSVALFDRDGYLLEVLEDPKYTESNRRHKWYPGVHWTDEYCGNNSIASVLKHKTPFQMPAFHHYMLFHQFVTASSAPIRNPEGELIGGVTLNLYYKTHPDSLNLAVATARAVEDALKIQKGLPQETMDPEHLFSDSASTLPVFQESHPEGQDQNAGKESVREEENAKTYLEWKKFTSGENAIDTTVVPQHIQDAWKRCRDRNFDPLSKPQLDILENTDLQKLLTDNKNLIETSKSILNQLFDVSKIANFSAALFDRNRYLLHVIHENQYTLLNKKFKWHAGVQWTEESTGNNIIDSVIRLQKPLQIIGSQHYRKSLHYVTAAGAPVFNPEGEIIGGVALVTFLYISHPHTLGMAIAAAQAITNELRVQKALAQCRTAFDETDIASRLQKAIISSIPEGLITLNAEGRITAINVQAKKMFGLENMEVIGKNLHEIYSGEENRAFLEILTHQDSISDTEVRIASPKGSGDYTLTCNQILSAVGSVIGRILILSEIKRIKSLVNKFGGAKANLKFADIYGQNARFKKIVEEAAVISKNTSNVLLLGESGTGKDILAQAIHNASPRKDGPYIAINCAAIPRDLIASELFGHEEGAFTGSRRGGNQGKFELADGGTIFLDEIAEAPLEIQAVLLRVIEDKCVVRVGGSQVRSVNVRIISATNRNLLAEVERGNFRKDLYYRLNVFNIHLPPLRERLDDIPLLTERFIKKYATVLGKTITGVDKHVVDLFMNYPWPGNVRELQNVVERMVNYASSGQVTASLIPPEIVDKPRMHAGTLDLESPVEAEKRLISHLINLKFRKKDIARQLNMSRANLYRKLTKYGLLDSDPP